MGGPKGFPRKLSAKMQPSNIFKIWNQDSNMMTIKAIFFDFDGVLTTNPSKHYLICKNLEKATRVPFEKIMSCYEPYILSMDRGKCTHLDIWEDFCKCLGGKWDSSILERTFAEVPVNKELFHLVEKLKPEYKVGIITNNTKERFEIIDKHLKLSQIFDTIILSANVGCRKPDGEEIFKKALESLDVAPEEVIFIDNTQKSLDIPKAMGFATIFHDDKKNDVSLLIKKLKAQEIDI